ncbi:hypothetical protein V8F20_005907 [Naviculisporaceae sp. PSN 640]
MARPLSYHVTLYLLPLAQNQSSLLLGPEGLYPFLTVWDTELISMSVPKSCALSVPRIYCSSSSNRVHLQIGVWLSQSTQVLHRWRTMAASWGQTIGQPAETTSRAHGGIGELGWQGLGSVGNRDHKSSQPVMLQKQIMFACRACAIHRHQPGSDEENEKSIIPFAPRLGPVWGGGTGEMGRGWGLFGLLRMMASTIEPHRGDR